jgi:recombinational DNA repair protein (RecF pathway)
MSEAAPRRARAGSGREAWRAFVLHRYDWSESSLILDLFTREGGRVVAAAKGAKRPSSTFRPVLLPFQPLHVLLSRRHADDEDEVLTLRGAEWAGDLAGDLSGDLAGSLTGDRPSDRSGDRSSDRPGERPGERPGDRSGGRSGERTRDRPDRTADSSRPDDDRTAPATATLLRGETLFLGFYVNELLMKLLARSDPHAALFDAYARTLAALAAARGEGQAQAALRAFELTLLQELGWLADLSVVTSTLDPLRAGMRYTLRAEGGLTPDTSDAIDGEHWLRMHAALADRAYGELRHACEHAAAAPLRAMLRQVLAVHLGHVSLRTRDVALGLRRLARR